MSPVAECADCGLDIDATGEDPELCDCCAWRRECERLRTIMKECADLLHASYKGGGRARDSAAAEVRRRLTRESGGPPTAP